MLVFLQFNWVLAFVCMAAFYKMGGLEASISTRGNHGLFWCALSLALSAMVIQGLHGGVMAVLLAQLCLFIGIAVYRLLRE